jgi:hypothetical protein
MFAHLRRTIGISDVGTRYAVEVYSPRKRRSPVTLPSGDVRFTPT